MDEQERRGRSFQEELPDDLSKAKAILEKYSGIPPDEVEPHLHAIRQKAWSIFPYGCIGRWRFLDFYITTLPIYPTLIQRLKSGDTLLDAGCAFGYVPRQLAFDGAPAANVIGSDLRQEFIDLGYELFRDRETFGGTFVVGNMLDANDKTLGVLDDRVDMIHAASFFHLFGWAEQVQLGERIVRFFKKGAKDAMILGRQRGEKEPLSREEHDQKGLGRYHHNPETFQALWDEIGSKTGTKWKVDAELTEEIRGRDSTEKRVGLRFIVRKVVG